MKIRPLGERVVVEPMKQEQKTKGGIYLPDTASKEKPQKGEVIAVGPDFKGVEVGDKSLFAKYGGTEVKMDEKEYIVLGEDDVLAVIEE